MSFSTPTTRSSHFSTHSFSLDRPSYASTDSLEQILGIEHSYFNDLTPHNKNQAALTLYDVLSNNSHSLGNLKYPEDAYDILLYAVNNNVSSVLPGPKPEQVYKVIIGAIKKCTLTPPQQKNLAHAILQRKGTDGLTKRMTLPPELLKEVLETYQKNLALYLSPVTTEIPQTFEGVKACAHTFFSGLKKVGASPHHSVLVGLLYAKSPDVELITYVIKKHLTFQWDYFSRKGIWQLTTQTNPPVITREKSLAYHFPGRDSVLLLHPGGLQSIDSFKEGSSNGIGIDDFQPGLCAYNRAFISNPTMVTAAQSIAEKNCDFPALFQFSADPKDIYVDTVGQIRLLPGTPFEDVKVYPLQPSLLLPTDSMIEKLYNENVKFAQRIIVSLKERVTIENPKDPVRRQLFETSSTSESSKSVSEKSSPSIPQIPWTVKNYLVFAVKCLIGIYLVRLTWKMMSYLKLRNLDQAI